MEAKIEVVKEAYANLVLQVRYMDIELARVMAEEAAKRVELTERRALLADRVRSAYDTDRTSPLETFLSGGTFTDVLAEMSYYIDVGEQDQALADQIAPTRRRWPRCTRRSPTRERRRTCCARRPPSRSGRSTRAGSRSSRRPRPTCKKLQKP